MDDKPAPSCDMVSLHVRLREVDRPLAAIVDKVTAELELAYFSALRIGTRAVVNSFRQAFEKGS